MFFVVILHRNVQKYEQLVKETGLPNRIIKNHSIDPGLGKSTGGGGGNITLAAPKRNDIRLMQRERERETHRLGPILSWRS